MHFLQLVFSRYMLKGSTMVLYCINICKDWSPIASFSASSSSFSSFFFSNNNINDQTMVLPRV